MACIVILTTQRCGLQRHVAYWINTNENSHSIYINMPSLWLELQVWRIGDDVFHLGKVFQKGMKILASWPSMESSSLSAAAPCDVHLFGGCSSLLATNHAAHMNLMPWACQNHPKPNLNPTVVFDSALKFAFGFWGRIEIELLVMHSLQF